MTSTKSSRGAGTGEVTGIAGFMVFRVNEETKEIQYLLLKKPRPPGNWSPPKGHVESSLKEDPLEAAERETREETGLLPEHYQVLHSQHEQFEYDTDDGAHKKVDLWPAHLLSWDQPISISKEHSEYQWTSQDKCLRFVKSQYQPIFSTIINKVKKLQEAQQLKLAHYN